ncbi:MAG: monovalent cation:proton antiporter-2 (CPA2) family protein [Pseudomonadota bacterium]
MENAGLHIPYLQETMIFLGAAVIIIPLLQWLRASPILGYLVVGVLIGPGGLAIIHDVDMVKPLAELGIVFLMFTIGLELSFERLRSMGRLVFGLGSAQVFVSAIIIGGISWVWGNSLESSIVIGACLALSSTAIVMQLLVERREISTPVGRTSFAILLSQDLAVVPIILLVMLLAAGGEQSIGLAILSAFGRAILAIAIILILGRYVLRYFFRLVAWTRNPELFTGMSLLAILFTAWGTENAGLSMALGAFLAGLLLAETEFRHQVEADIQPFKGLLLGLFFISVGMGIEPMQIIDQGFWLAVSVIGLIMLKAFIITGLCLLFRLPLEVAVRSGVMLGQGGEFAFVVIGLALSVSLLPEANGQFIMIVAGLSMFITPFLAHIGQWLAKKLVPEADQSDLTTPDAALEDLRGHVIIAGYGRIGQVIASLLCMHRIPYIALDINAEKVRQQRDEGDAVYFGDAGRIEVLKKIGIEQAASVVVTMDNPETTHQTVEQIRQYWPDIPVFVRVQDEHQVARMNDLNVDGVVQETFESSLALADNVLRSFDIPGHTIRRYLERFRHGAFSLIDDK